MRMNLQPYEENLICLALFHGMAPHRRECTTWPFWTLSKTLSTKWTLQTLLIYSQLQGPGKDCFKCFFLRICNIGFHSHLYLYQNSFAVSSIWEKKFLFHFLRLLHFQKSYMNTQVRFQVGPGALISPVRQGPCGFNPALLGGSPSVEFPHRPLLFPAVKTTTCHFPTVNLVSYTKKHQTVSTNAQ